MVNIEEITICLHCGSRLDIVEDQMQRLKPLESHFNLTWNNRINRFPFTYTSFSLLINHSIVTSPSEFIIFINDRSFPEVHHILKIVELLRSGFAWVTLYGAGLMGFSKQLINKIGWWDERYILGGWEDRDWVFRLKEANLAIYEANESEYDNTWKSVLNGKPGVNESIKHWIAKWDTTNNLNIYRLLPEENYPHWNLFNWKINKEIQNSWLKWDDSILGKGEKGPFSGDFSSEIIANRPILHKEHVKNRFLNIFKY
jgi:hypothetical protein